MTVTLGLAFTSMTEHDESKLTTYLREPNCRIVSVLQRPTFIPPSARIALVAIHESNGLRQGWEKGRGVE